MCCCKARAILHALTSFMMYETALMRTYEHFTPFCTRVLSMCLPSILGLESTTMTLNCRPEQWASNRTLWTTEELHK